MNYFKLTQAYLAVQMNRVGALRKAIAGQSTNLVTGRVIPDDGDLAIGMGRRLDASVMFLDICKFSARPAETEADQGNLLRVLTFFFSEAIKIIEDYGGVVEKNTGDGLMAYFTKTQDATAQHMALSAALTIFSATKWMLNPVIVSSALQPIDFRICIDHGVITVAEVGAARRFRGIVAVGTTANVASKMLSFAGADQLLIGHNVLGGLPESWRNTYVRLHTAETGWTYISDGRPYCFWEFTGRWVIPT